MVAGSEFEDVNRYQYKSPEEVRALDHILEGKIDNFSESSEDIIIYRLEYPWTEQNSAEIPSDLTEGLSEKGEIELGSIDLDNKVFHLYLDSVEANREDQGERLGKDRMSIERATDDEWQVVGHLLLEPPVGNPSGYRYTSGVYYEDEEKLRGSDDFSEISSNIFGRRLDFDQKIREKYI